MYLKSVIQPLQEGEEGRFLIIPLFFCYTLVYNKIIASAQRARCYIVIVPWLESLEVIQEWLYPNYFRILGFQFCPKCYSTSPSSDVSYQPSAE